MAASELVLAPHTQATGSYSVMIPLTYGKPVIASDLAIFREINDRGGCVDIIPNRDSAALANRAGELLSNPSRRAELAAKARAFARSHAWPAIAARTAQVYEAAIADAARPPYS
jgi:phosphatidylinositol alpha-mannosyltransferase